MSVTVAPMDFTQYGSIKFFAYKTPGTTSAPGANIIFRAGSDTDYWEFDYPVDNLPPNTCTSASSCTGNWMELTINQIGGTRPNAWASGSAGGSVIQVGSPNLTSVAEMKFGVTNTPAPPICREKSGSMSSMPPTSSSASAMPPP